MVLEAIKYERGSLQILDQLQLPHKVTYIRIRDTNDGFDAIKSMKVRGAPAIAIVAALSLAVKLHVAVRDNEKQESTIRPWKWWMLSCLDHLVTARPTAVNLAGAVMKLKKIIVMAAESKNDAELAEEYIRAAEAMLENDVQDNEAIGRHGSEWIISQTKQSTTAHPKEEVSVITHCNTGSLATAGYGTALGVIRSLHAQKHLRQAYCTETRPYNQGSRLTAFEFVHDHIPATLITDSMAAALLRLRKKSDRIAAIVVGADRVAANGDTANKIGTYGLAILARHHGVKFLVAAPRTTIDLDTPDGSSITIEERAPEELTRIRGPPYTNGGDLEIERSETISIAAHGINVWNPAFDVTPAGLIDGIVTEVGVAEKDSSGDFNLRKFL